MPRLTHVQYGTDNVNWWDFYVDYQLVQDQATNKTTINCQSGYICKKANSGTYVSAYYQLIPVNTDNAKVILWTEDLKTKQVGNTRQIVSHSVTITHNSDGTHPNIDMRIYCQSGRATIGTLDKTWQIAIPPFVQGPFVRDGGVWKRGTLYVKDAGVWKQGKVYAKNNGVWTLVK